MVMTPTLLTQNLTDHRAALLNALVVGRVLSTDAVQDLREALQSWPSDSAMVSYLTTHSLASASQINQAYAVVFHIPYMQSPPLPDANVLRLLPYEVCDRYKIVPIEKTGAVVTVAVADPLHVRENQQGVLAQLKHDKQLQFKLVMISRDDFERLLAGYPIGGTPASHTAVPETAAPAKVPTPTNQISLLGKKIPRHFLTKLPKTIAEYYRFVVFDAEPAHGISAIVYHLAAVNPTDPRLLQTIRYIENANQIHFKLFQTDAPSIEYALSLYERDAFQRNRPAQRGGQASPPAEGGGRDLSVNAETPTMRSSEFHHYLVAGAVSLQGRVIPPELLTKIPYDVANRYRFLVFEQHANDYSIATDSPNDSLLPRIWRYIEQQHHIRLRIYSCDKASFNTALALYSDAPKQVQNVFVTSPQITVVSNAANIGQATQISAAPTGEPSLAPPAEDQPIKWWEKLLALFGVRHHPPEIVTGSVVVATVPPPTTPVPVAAPISPSPTPPGVAMPAVTKASPPPSSAKNDDAEHVDEDGVYKAVAKATVKTEKDEDDLGSLLDKDVETADELEQIIKEGFIPKIVAAIVSYAITLHASDVHIEAELKDVRVRYRVDGMLQDVARMPLESQAAIVSRIKILSRLKIDETRIPQDGRFDVAFKDREVDLRVSSMPMVHGEKIVMRILDKSHGIMTLEDLGVVGRAFDVIIDAIKKPYGIMLSTGPTGSGKSTTLYAILNRISVPTVNVITLEDPVEYEIGGVNQSQIKPKIGFTFAEGLRSVLRQDPNIIMVGEIRDSETANMATHAALTGHLVLSTLHTNDAPGALPRLMNMGVEPFLITSSINAVEAQRLVRKICPNCKEETQLPPAIVQEIKDELAKIPQNNPKDRARITPEFHFYHGKGCAKCQNGYRGRIGIYEVMPMTDKIEELAIQKATATDIQRQAILEGMITIKQDGLLKALAGQTTVDEVLRETSV